MDSDGKTQDKTVSKDTMSPIGWDGDGPLLAMVRTIVETAEQATAAQQQTNITCQSALTMGIATLYSIDTAATGVAAKHLQSGTATPAVAEAATSDVPSDPMAAGVHDARDKPRTPLDASPAEVLRLAREHAQVLAMYNAVTQQRLDAASMQAMVTMTVATVLSLDAAEVAADGVKTSAASAAASQDAGPASLPPVRDEAAPALDAVSAPRSSTGNMLPPGGPSAPMAEEGQRPDVPLATLSAQLAIQDATQLLRWQSNLACILASVAMSRFTAGKDPAWLSGVAAANQMARDALDNAERTVALAERILRFGQPG